MGFYMGGGGALNDVNSTEGPTHSSQNNFAVGDGNFETSWQLIKISL